SIFPKIENSMSENPVTLRPGRARLSTAPDAIGSLVNATTIGIERVNFVRIGMTRSPTTTMTSGFSATRFAVARRPTLVELNIPALGPSHPCQFLPESPNVRLRFRVTFRVGHQDANPPHLTGLLPVRRERPRRRAAEQRDELAALHSITPSARASNCPGTSIPSAFAVLRLITSSTFVGACTGRSAGFSPLRIRST